MKLLVTFSLLALSLGFPEQKKPYHAFQNVFDKFPDLKLKGDAGDPLLLTPYIKAGEIDQAKQLASNDVLSGWESYSGYFTVNEQYNSNLFFWFILAKEDPANAPVILWLQGGPGGPSTYGLFVECGPYAVKNLTLVPRNITWTQKYSIVYIDQPVGTGFSFTDNDKGYATNEDEIATDLYSALTQFFTLFSEYQNNDFYASGESYAGKYVPAIGYKIHTENPTADVKINLKGVILGDALIDPYTQLDYSEFLYYVGLIDDNGRAYFQSEQAKVRQAVDDGEWKLAADYYHTLMGPDFAKYSGYQSSFNIIKPKLPDLFSYADYLVQPDIRKAIHIGNTPYGDITKIAMLMYNDFIKSVKPQFLVLLENGYKILTYNGQLDIIVANSLTVNFLNKLEWSGAKDYANSPTIIWKIEDDIAGYVRGARNMVHAVVLDCGHLAPTEHPERIYDLVVRFISNQSFYVTA